ncbi:hypothetical protein GP486_006245 [Trichoglossum hirsutum]|uniref:Uncharacterized protein n=1 Tax=Trichoglossum hirsutum TaxID=265104 RepID=A0A9P8IH70_9PEZI|nr:hypothetical protein GP486_006245 [Trichoglossum hirsutum]
MYPDWPQSTADLVPLPNCDGPKLEAFDFQGPQKIKFLDHIGDGAHSRVFKVEILERVYALKIFRFVYDYDWLGPYNYTHPDNLEAMSAFYNYSEPFSAECRAFGRLKEAGYEKLAVPCFGYLLLNEDHERVLMEQFSNLNLNFNGNGDYPGGDDMRARFLGRDGRPPPLRAIVKEFGQADEPLRTKGARTLLQDMIKLQQLGIISLDVAHRQLVDGKLADLSTAITLPHFITTPELNSRLNPEWISAMEYQTFHFCIYDFQSFDEMVEEWNDDHENRKDKISVHAFPGGNYFQVPHNLRRLPSRERVYSFVDPRLWRNSVIADAETSGTKAARGQSSGQKAKKSNPKKGITRRRLCANPPKWYYDCDSTVAAKLKRISFSTSLSWEYEDGLIFPRNKTYKYHGPPINFAELSTKVPDPLHVD